MSNFRELVRQAAEKAGTQAKLAEAIGLSQQGVSFLINEASSISAETAMAIDKFTQGEISKKMLRPDIFGE